MLLFHFSLPPKTPSCTGQRLQPQLRNGSQALSALAMELQLPSCPEREKCLFFFSGNEASCDFPAAAAQRESLLRIFPREMEVCPSWQML